MRFKTVLMCLGVASATAAGGNVNLLANAGFEDGLNGWNAFGNAFGDGAPARTGTGAAKLFGNFSGGFNVTGIFQEFSASEGDLFEARAYSRHNSNDALFGDGPSDGVSNWAVMKMAFKDANDAEIGFAETIVLNGTFATDTWHDSGLLQATAVAGTVQVEFFFLFLQPGFDGGAALFDDTYFALVPAPGSLAALGLFGAIATRRRR